jgi:hypothetical protein
MRAPISVDLRCASQVRSSVAARSETRRGGLRSAVKLMQRVRATGSAAPTAMAGTGRPCSSPTQPTCACWSRRPRPSRWPSSRRRCSGAPGCGLGCRRSTNALRRIGLPHKRDPRERPSRTAPPSTANAGGGASGSASWIPRGSSLSMRPAPPPTRGPALRPRPARRPYAAVPHGHWRTTTFVAALRQSGVIAPADPPRTDDRPRVSRLCRAVPGAVPRARRRGGGGQPHRPQVRWRPTSARPAGAGSHPQPRALPILAASTWSAGAHPQPRVLPFLAARDCTRCGPTRSLAPCRCSPRATGSALARPAPLAPFPILAARTWRR